MNFLVKGSAALVNSVMNLPYGFKLMLLFVAFKEAVRKIVRGKRKKSAKKESTEKKKKAATGKKKSASGKTLGKRERLCKMFTASVKSLNANKNRTAKQTACLKAARAGKKKYCG